MSDQSKGALRECNVKIGKSLIGPETGHFFG